MRRTFTRVALGVFVVSALVGCTPPDFGFCRDMDIFEGLFSLSIAGPVAETSEAMPFAVEPSRKYAWIGEVPSVVGVSSSEGKMVWSFELDGKTYHAEYIRVE